VLQLLGGRFWDVRDCLPVQHASAAADGPNTRSQSSPFGALGVECVDFVDACVPAAFAAQNDARDILLLEQALQVLERVM
jgi:hypothetical protein